MKTEEALQQITYMKDMMNKSRLKALSGYPAFILGGLVWFAGNLLSILSRYYIWVDYPYIIHPYLYIAFLPGC